MKEHFIIFPMTLVEAVLGKNSQKIQSLKVVDAKLIAIGSLSTSTFVLVCFLVPSPLFVSLYCFFALYQIVHDSSYIKEVFKVVKLTFE